MSNSSQIWSGVCHPCKASGYTCCAHTPVFEAAKTKEQPDEWIVEELKKIAAMKPTHQGHVEIARAFGAVRGIAQGILEVLALEAKRPIRESGSSRYKICRSTANGEWIVFDSHDGEAVQVWGLEELATDHAKQLNEIEGGNT